MRKLGRGSAFACGVGLLFAGALAAVRCTAAGGLPGHPLVGAENRHPLGGIAPPWQHDHLQHLAWAKLSALGLWRYDDPFTFDSHAALLVNPLLALVGWSSSAVGVEPMTTVFVLSVVAAFVSPILVYAVARRCGLDASTSAWAAVLSSFGSGLSGVLRLLHAVGMIDDRFPSAVDRTFPDAQAFAGALAFPFIGVCHAWGLAVVRWMLHVEIHAMRWWESFALAASAAFLGLSHPYEHVVVTASYAGWCLSASRAPSAKRRWAVCATVAVGSGAALAYHLWLRTQPVWSEVVGDSLALGRSRWDWSIGYGLLPMFALFGIRRAFAVGGPLLWFAGWGIGLYLLLAGCALPHSKICSLGHLPLGLLAAVGVQAIWRWAGAWPMRALLAILVGPALFGSPVAFAWEYLAGKPSNGDYDRWRVVEALRADAENSRPRLLTDTATARWAAAFAGARVYAGNQYKTPKFLPRSFELRSLGVEPSDSDAPGVAALPSPTEETVEQHLLEFLRRHAFDAAILRADVPAARILARRIPPDRQAVYGRWRYFRLHVGGAENQNAAQQMP